MMRASPGTARCTKGLKRGGVDRRKILATMPMPTPEEKRRMAETPRGTWVLMLIIGFLLVAGWALLYFGRFLGNGPVS